MKFAGTWWNDKSIELVEVDGSVYALCGWNGEVFASCWECSGDCLQDASEEEYTLRPIHRFERDGIDLNTLEENSKEWEDALEVVDYSVSTN